MKDLFANLYNKVLSFFHQTETAEGEASKNVMLAAGNIQGVKTSAVNNINVYDILKYDTVVITKSAVSKIEEVYA